MEWFDQRQKQLQNEKRLLARECLRLRNLEGGWKQEAQTAASPNFCLNDQQDDSSNIWSTRSPEASDFKEEYNTSSPLQSNENTEDWLPNITPHRIKSEPHVRRNSLPNSSKEWQLGDPESKKDLVVIALKAIGGVGTLDDVAKWIRKHRPGVLGTHMSRKSISRDLCRQASNGVLNRSKVRHDRRLNIYTVPGMVQSKLPQQKKETLPVARDSKDAHVASAISRNPSNKVVTPAGVGYLDAEFKAETDVKQSSE